MPARSSTPTEALLAEEAAAAPGGVRALDGVSFAAPQGTLLALVGANGSGKSTLLRVLAGILPLHAGRARVLGLDPLREAHALRPRIGYAEQHPALDPELTGAETLRLFHALRGLPTAGRAARVAAALDAHGLGAAGGRLVGGWSGGERQRLHLALATLHAPPVLLLDEPTAALDPEGRRRLWNRLAEHRAAGGTALVATHDLAEAAANCDRVLLLHAGRVAADDAPEALVVRHGRTRATATLRDAAEAHAAAGALAEAPGGAGAETEVEGATVTAWLPAAGGADPLLALLAVRGIEPARYERSGPDLASACRRLTGARIEAGGAGGGGRGRGRGR